MEASSDNVAAGKEKLPSHSPIAYGMINFLLGGISYIFLRQYKRFFVYFMVMVIGIFVPLISVVLWIFSSGDAYRIAGKIKSKEMQIPAHNSTLMIICLVMWIAIAVLAFLGILLTLLFPSYGIDYAALDRIRGF